TDVLKVIKEYIPIETCVLMVPPDESEQPIHVEFREILGPDIIFKRENRFEFYREVKSENTCLAIATGEMRTMGNILISIVNVKRDDRSEFFAVDRSCFMCGLPLLMPRDGRLYNLVRLPG